MNLININTIYATYCTTEKDGFMTELKDERWILEKYNDLIKNGNTDYALISLKIKRFRTIHRLLGREESSELLVYLYDALTNLLQTDEYIGYVHLNCYHLLIRFSSDEDLYSRLIQFDSVDKTIKDGYYKNQIFIGMGAYRLGEHPVDYYIAQYNADLCRADSIHNSFRNSHFEIYGYTFNDPNEMFLDLQDKIMPALQNEDFKLYLQPKVDLKTGKIESAEALVRWIDPESGMIPLKDFLPGLESNGVIRSVDYFIFNQVCKKIQKWLQVYGKKIQISVNLAKSSFDHRDFFKFYTDIFEKYDIPKDCIEIELIESIILNQVDRVNVVVDQICSYGFHCSLDDFGSGYSSYSVLANTNLSMVKIDRSLFCNEGTEAEKTVIKHIVQTAHELNMKTVAEGIETQNYVDYLKMLDCEFIQGFIFYRPMPADEFEERFLINGETAIV